MKIDKFLIVFRGTKDIEIMFHIIEVMKNRNVYITFTQSSNIIIRQLETEGCLIWKENNNVYLNDASSSNLIYLKNSKNYKELTFEEFLDM